jgi:hypothetical protein
MPSRSTWTKIAIGVAVVVVLYLIVSRRSCNCKRAAMPVVTAVPLRQMMTTQQPIAQPELFAPYEPEDDMEEEPYADYVPDEREDYVDASDTYSSPEFKAELLD